MHLAAANGELESVRVLLDAGADVQGAGDLHKGDVIGWAMREGNEAVIHLLLERGARHHIFSAMALGDRALVERLVEEDPDCLLRRRSRFESGHTPLHAAFAPPDGVGFLAGKPDYAMLALLIELGADLEATDDKGRTPLAVAMLRGDREAMRLLQAAGAVAPPVAPRLDATQLAAAAASVFKDRQLRVAHAALAGSNADVEIRFDEDLYVPCYGGRQFSIRDLNGLSLIFWQPDCCLVRANSPDRRPSLVRCRK